MKLSAITAERNALLTRLGLILILVLGLTVRLLGITWGLPAAGRYLAWTPDESTFVSSMYRMNPLKLELNPGYFKTPSLTTYLLMFGLGSGSVLGAVELVPDKSFYIQNLNQRGRIFLIGRLNSVLFGILSVLLLYKLVQRLYPDRSSRIPLLAAALLAVLPGHVVWSHYLSQNPLVTFWIILTFYWLVRLMENHHARWYVAAGLTTGLAISTNYNALLLLVPLFLAHLFSADGKLRLQPVNVGLFLKWSTWRLPGLAIISLIIGFCAATPYALLDADFFLSEFFWEFDSVGGTTFLGNWDAFGIMAGVMPSGLGWGLYALGGAGLGWLVSRRRWRGGEILLIIWTIFYFILTARAGHFASVGRVLPMLVFFPTFAAVFVDELHTTRPSSKWLTVTLVGTVLVTTFIVTAAVNTYYLADSVRRDASAWIFANIPRHSSVGTIGRDPWWYSPDIVSTDYLHPEVTGGLYRHYVYNFKAVQLSNYPADFIIVPSQELTYRIEHTDEPTKSEFRQILDREYRRIAEFSLCDRLGWACPILNLHADLYGNLWAAPDIWIYQRVGDSK